MKILVFGATGMLGRYVCVRLSKEHSVSGLTRNDLNLFDVKKSQLSAALELYQPEIVINCAGVIKPMIDALGVNAIYVNSIFPRLLAEACKEKNIKMIHVSTDCVFDGINVSEYTEEDKHTATDIYGKTKSLGENEECCVVRTSIIGEELGQARSLIEWAKTQKGKTVKGFTDHRWNGVSCLQLTELFSLMTKDNIFWDGVRHVYSTDAVSKYELLKTISEVYDLDLNVVAHFSGSPCRRDLTTVNVEWGDYLQKHIPSIKKQLTKIKKFKLT